MSGPVVTIYDVAQRAAVSISTVSLAINHPERVKPATRARIHEAIDELGFVPWEQAVARAKRGVGRIAVVAPFSHYPSYTRRLAGVLREVGDQGTQVLVYDHADVAALESPLLASLPIRGHVDGLIVMGVPLAETIARRLTRRLPTVLVDAWHPAFPCVTVDYYAAGLAVGQRLRALGHNHAATLMGAAVSLPEDSPGWLRLTGFRSAFDEPVRAATVHRQTGGGDDAWDQVFPDGLTAPDRPTAVFAEWDLLATRFWSAARRRGHRVPDDLTIVGYDDGPMEEAIGLSTVTQPFEESGAVGLRLLRDLIEGRAVESRVLPLALAERETHGPVPDLWRSCPSDADDTHENWCPD
jgi:LacI family transcriptional regulator